MSFKKSFFKNICVNQLITLINYLKIKKYLFAAFTIVFLLLIDFFFAS